VFDYWGQIYSFSTEYLTIQTTIKTKEAPIWPPKSGGGDFSAIISETGFPAQHIKHLIILFRKDPLPFHP
jgi:hypothetical protein